MRRLTSLRIVSHSDMAILFISLHMYLQVFPPKNELIGSDGLYRVRKWVYVLWFGVPSIIGSIAFVNPHPFIGTGAFCELPVRPLWYRVALFWLPKWLAWLHVMYVCVKIYRHVGNEFRVFGAVEAKRTSELGETKPAPNTAERGPSLFRRSRRNPSRPGSARPGMASFGAGRRESVPRITFLRPNPLGTEQEVVACNTSRRQSTPSTKFSDSDTRHDTIGDRSQSDTPGAHPSSSCARVSAHVSNDGPATENPSWHYDSGLSAQSTHHDDPHSKAPEEAVSRAPRREGVRISGAMDERRMAIQRQLRLLFIYPLTSMMLWVFPFIGHCMSYHEKYARDPSFGVDVVSTFSIVTMTVWEVIIFCWREKPWSNIPGSDGTIRGSLCFWRFVGGPTWLRSREPVQALSCLTRKEPDQPPSAQAVQTTGDGFAKSRPSPRPLSNGNVSAPGSEHASSRRPSISSRNWSNGHRRNFSGGSDRKHLQVDRAWERLAQEREDALSEQARWSSDCKRRSLLSQSSTAPNWGRDRDLFEDDEIEQRQPPSRSAAMERRNSAFHRRTTLPAPLPRRSHTVPGVLAVSQSFRPAA